ncbi:MAG: 4'-phosphopantetheinyl transferase superfamily protein [Burkholderiales bacterium]|nr:4'-phosphopantetheinyl transferase superfamily protein [Burkholderiales bacterium]MDE2433972.1 4'-phosphopantetheinyl transferase superfamily protein [Burkholderiales bacterium]
MNNSIYRLDAPNSIECQIWLIDLRNPLKWGEAQSLSDAEQERAKRFRFEIDARRYVASHTALRHILGTTLGVSPQDVAIDLGPHGKPHPLDSSCHFNLSHSDDWALIAIHHSEPIGIDLECYHPFSDWALLAQQNYTPDEYQALASLPAEQQALGFLRCWTRKEACLKALGSGLLIEPHGFEAGVGAEPSRVEIKLPQGGACQMDVVSLALPNAAESDDAPMLLGALALVTPQTAGLCF